MFRSCSSSFIKQAFLYRGGSFYILSMRWLSCKGSCGTQCLIFLYNPRHTHYTNRGTITHVWAGFDIVYRRKAPLPLLHLPSHGQDSRRRPRSQQQGYEGSWKLTSTSDIAVLAGGTAVVAPVAVVDLEQAVVVGAVGVGSTQSSRITATLFLDKTYPWNQRCNDCLSCLNP
jgi:hypothetical protein